MDNERSQDWMDDSRFHDWRDNQATPEEEDLVERVLDFSELFVDMLFQQGTTSYNLIRCQSQLPTGDIWIDDAIDLPPELEYFSYTFFLYKVESLGKYGGAFNSKERTLAIPSEHLDDDRTILHEMIHLHEFVIDKLPQFYRDMLFWALYQDLRVKIPKLDEIITDHSHLLNGSSLYYHGGVHDLLFLLKSFDLDIQMDFPLGTVFAYGREDIFKNYKYIKSDQNNHPED